MRPTSTIGRSRRSLSFCIAGGYTAPLKVGQKPAVPKIEAEGPMSRLVILIVIILIIAGAIVFLSSQAREVPTQPVEVDVTNAVGD